MVITDATCVIAIPYVQEFFMAFSFLMSESIRPDMPPPPFEMQQSLAKETTLPTLETTRIKMDDILVGTDFSPTSDAALNFAATVAKLFRARVNVLHVVPPMAYSNELALGVATVQSSLRSTAKARMSELEGSPELRCVRHRTMVCDGYPGSMIHEISQQMGSDLIVLGTHGAQGTEKMLLGSVAEEIFRSATCPVMTVGPNVKATASSFNSILLATDLSVHSLRAAQHAVSWALESRAQLALLHVINDTPRKLTSVLEQRIALLELRSLLSNEAMFWCDPITEVAFGHPEEEILKAAERLGTDLIVMAVKRASALATHIPGSLASKIVRKAQCPVLTIRENYAD
jgi:nucleotide-binding universal stress UspA family protein